MRPDIIQVFCEEMPKRVCVVSNGTYPLKRFENLYFYWVSMDGTEKVHDSIRGEGSYTKTKQNILNYISGQDRNGKPAWRDIWITMTINSLSLMKGNWGGVGTTPVNCPSWAILSLDHMSDISDKIPER